MQLAEDAEEDGGGVEGAGVDEVVDAAEVEAESLPQGMPGNSQLAIPKSRRPLPFRSTPVCSRARVWPCRPRSDQLERGR